MSLVADKYYWIPHPDLVWVPGRSLDSSNASCLDWLTIHDENLTLTSTQVKNLERVSEQSLINEGIDNLINLEDVGEGPIIHALRTRYNRSDIYTYIGTILVSVNPYKLLPIYSPHIMQQYKTEFQTLPPD